MADTKKSSDTFDIFDTAANIVKMSEMSKMSKKSPSVRIADFSMKKKKYNSIDFALQSL